MKYYQLEAETEFGEKIPLVVTVASRYPPEQRPSSSWTSCIVPCALFVFVLLFGMGLWKYHLAGQVIAHALGNPTLTQNSSITFDLDPDIQVEVDQGILQGKRLKSRAGRNYLAFLGIPYAKPPLAELRFQPPVPADSWEGIRDSTYFRDNCVEKQRVGDAKLADQPDLTDGSEDCLYLNIYTPKEKEELTQRSKRFPVMVYIHGGAGGAFGSGQKYGADYFMDEDVVLITFEFRLGVLGNLNTHTSLASGNQALKDHLMALQWVQDNIKAFGGDRQKVTIFGNSFGGIQITAHMLSPLGKGLYHRAIAQSGSILYPGFFTEDPLHDATRLGDLVGCTTSNSTTEGQNVDPNLDLTRCLLNQTAESLVLEGLKFKNKFNYVFTISTDTASESENIFLPMGPMNSLQAGTMKSIPFLTGVVDAEGLKDSLEVMTDPDTLAQFQQNWTSIIVPTLYLQHSTQDPARLREIALKIRQFYLGQNETAEETILDEVNFRNFTNMFTDRLYTHPAATVSSYLRQKYNETKNGGRNRRRENSNAYFYHFTHEVDSSRTDSLQEKYDGNTEYFGECHADELQFFFPFDAFPYIPMDHPYIKFSQMVVKLWANFAKTGVPTAANLTWVPTDENHPYQYMDLNDDPKMEESLLVPRIEFWNQFNDTELYM